MNDDFELVDLEIPAMPGLCLAVSRDQNGRWAPRVWKKTDMAVAYFAGWRVTGEVLQWVSLWVQNVVEWELEPNSQIMPISNLGLESLWRGWCEGMKAGSDGAFRVESFDASPRALILSEDGRSIAADFRNWELCRDEELLKRESLPGYRTTMDRVIWNGNRDKPQFRRVSPVSLETETFGGSILLNAACAPFAVSHVSTLTLLDFANLLSGQTCWANVGNSPVSGADLSRPGRRSSDSSSSNAAANRGFFFLMNDGPGHLCEVLHLKLAVIHGMLVRTGAIVGAARTPILGLSPSSFGVRLSPGNEALPFYWSQCIQFEDIPHSILLELEGDERAIISQPSDHSVYRSSRLRSPVQGVARVYQTGVVQFDIAGRAILEARVMSDKLFQSNPRDVIQLELTGPKGDFRICGRLEGVAGVSGDYLFRSLPTTVPADIRKWLMEAGSFSSDHVRFLLVPQPGTPCDLYSVGVIALQVLLGLPVERLAQALDHLLRLARDFRRHVEKAGADCGDLAEFISQFPVASYEELLGPHLLTANPARNSDTAFRHVPSKLWWDVIEFLTRFFPGEAISAFCSSYQDFNILALGGTFSEPIRVVEKLMIQSRDAIFGRPAANREIRELIKHYQGSNELK